MDWGRFSYEFRVHPSEAMNRELISIEASREATLNLVLPAPWRAQLDKLNRVRAVHGTTALEGNPLTEAEVSQEMEKITDPEAAIAAETTKAQRQILNAGRAQEWVRRRFGPSSPPLKLDDILLMHRTITEASDEKNNQPGAFRTFPVVVGAPELGGVHRGAPGERVRDLMDEYIQFVNSRRMDDQHPVIRALLAHYFLVTIHPFGDGNGRVSRLVEAGILYQGGYNVHGFYGLSNYFYRNGAEYKITLQACRSEQPFDVTPFIAFGLKGFASELKGINNFIKTKLNRVVYRDTLVKAFNTKTGDRRRAINQREYNLLTFLLEESEPIDPFAEQPSKEIRFESLRDVPFIRAAYANVTPRTFYRELMRLSQLGFIRFERPNGVLVVQLEFSVIGKY